MQGTLLGLPGESPRLLAGNLLFAPMREIKVRKNEMKLRKKEIEVPKYCTFAPWGSNNSP